MAARSLQSKGRPVSMSVKSSPMSQVQNSTPASGETNRNPQISTCWHSREPTVPAACLACRSKHLKCDGQAPCARCINIQSECVYVASRRGYKGPQRWPLRNPNKRQATSSPDLSSSIIDCPNLLGAPTGSTSLPAIVGCTFGPPGVGLPPRRMNAKAQFRQSQHPSNMHIHNSCCTVNGLALSGWSANQTGGRVPIHVPLISLEERCFDSFFHHFHASHPFVLPKPFLLQISKETSLKPLLAAIRWIGSIYIESGAVIRERLLKEAYDLVYHSERIEDGFLIQSMMLLTVGLDGSCQQKKARSMLGNVEMLAVELELNTREFATIHGRGVPVLEESWRRTWWDLFVIDGMIAVVHGATDFLLFDVAAGAALPCEEDQYLTARIPIPLYLDDLEKQDFSDGVREFSSFAYRVLCGRNLGKFMRVSPINGPEDKNLMKIETLLTNWQLHLPQSKRHASERNGKLDEMMFQAHMMYQATSIMLHQPHSQLDSSPTQDINSCALHQIIPACELFDSHTRRTIQSANSISTMITHRVPLLSHTHFFTCVITLSSIVHLSRWALFFIPQDDDDVRQLIRLNIGALNHLSDAWVAADRACGRVEAVAQEIYRLKKQQISNSHFWPTLSQEDMFNLVATDASMINEFENLETISDMFGECAGGYSGRQNDA